MLQGSICSYDNSPGSTKASGDNIPMQLSPSCFTAESATFYFRDSQCNPLEKRPFLLQGPGKKTHVSEVYRIPFRQLQVHQAGLEPVSITR